MPRLEHPRVRHNAELRGVELRHVPSVRVLGVECVEQHISVQHHQHYRRGVEQHVLLRIYRQHCQHHHLDVEPHDGVLHHASGVHESDERYAGQRGCEQHGGR